MGRRVPPLLREIRVMTRQVPRDDEAIRIKVTELNQLRVEMETRRRRQLQGIATALTPEQLGKFALIQETFEIETLRLLQERGGLPRNSCLPGDNGGPPGPLPVRTGDRGLRGVNLCPMERIASRIVDPTVTSSRLTGATTKLWWPSYTGGSDRFRRVAASGRCSVIVRWGR